MHGEKTEEKKRIKCFLRCWSRGYLTVIFGLFLQRFMLIRRLLLVLLSVSTIHSKRRSTPECPCTATIQQSSCFCSRTKCSCTTPPPVTCLCADLPEEYHVAVPTSSCDVACDLSCAQQCQHRIDSGECQDTCQNGCLDECSTPTTPTTTTTTTLATTTTTTSTTTPAPMTNYMVQYGLCLPNCERNCRQTCITQDAPNCESLCPDQCLEQCGRAQPTIAVGNPQKTLSIGIQMRADQQIGPACGPICQQQCQEGCLAQAVPAPVCTLQCLSRCSEACGRFKFLTNFFAPTTTSTTASPSHHFFYPVAPRPVTIVLDPLIAKAADCNGKCQTKPKIKLVTSCDYSKAADCECGPDYMPCFRRQKCCYKMKF
ncbi:unnamed protein product [Caenorhabditis auriculariae]|uniref:Uncharacterized protein n=1 Tax=Caenorhabditis auriculariae TaxID=2777116 RepID=A0A8S1HL87_9PELO|nr:unnamed protein product [Caenorhabditis auriculariae]